MVMVMAALVVLVRVTICLVEAVPKAVLPKTKLAGAKERPLPIVRLTIWLAFGMVPLAA
jgi:hypothetical protein